MQYIRDLYDRLAANVDENRLWQDMKDITEKEQCPCGAVLSFSCCGV